MYYFKRDFYNFKTDQSYLFPLKSRGTKRGKGGRSMRISTQIYFFINIRTSMLSAEEDYGLKRFSKHF